MDALFRRCGGQCHTVEGGWAPQGGGRHGHGRTRIGRGDGAWHTGRAATRLNPGNSGRARHARQADIGARQRYRAGHFGYGRRHARPQWDADAHSRLPGQRIRRQPQRGGQRSPGDGKIDRRGGEPDGQICDRLGGSGNRADEECRIGPVSVKSSGTFASRRLTFDANMGNAACSVRGGGTVSTEATPQLNLKFDGAVPFSLFDPATGGARAVAVGNGECKYRGQRRRHRTGNFRQCAQFGRPLRRCAVRHRGERHRSRYRYRFGSRNDQSADRSHIGRRQRFGDWFGRDRRWRGFPADIAIG